MEVDRPSQKGVRGENFVKNAMRVSEWIRRGRYLAAKSDRCSHLRLA